MPHFFVENSGSTLPVGFVKVCVGKTVQVALWGANVNGTTLIPSCNDASIASVTGPGSKTPDGMIRNIVITGNRIGNVMLEARLGQGGPVWGYTQLVVSNVPTQSDVGVQAVTIAQKELAAGVFEDDGNTNTGTRIDEYQSLFGLHGQPWCAMFVYWCFAQAAKTMAVKTPLPKMAAAQTLLVWGRNNNKLVDEPTAGDVLIVKPGTHVGLVVGNPTKGMVPSIEGNTWSHGTENDHSDGVYAKKHATPTCYYLRV